MDYKANTVVLISVQETDARKICERIENAEIDDFDNLAELQDIDPNHVLVYALSNFMDLVNNRELDVLTEYFITFVNAK